ncbi:MAG TPA: Gfo/Idh/MocA family oxidoreductase, partial [Deinococcales bacterium]|nr:Gfo/Idh/MocA family oxidoreductase [Deinococcales bacterium]
RDAGRAAAFAAKHEVPRSYGSYDELLADPEVDAIYNPLPNSEHHPWTLRALAAGKHVLCEKSASLNTREAEDMAGRARETGKLFLEAFSSRYHPQYDRVTELLATGAIGEPRVIRAHFGFNLDRPDDIRWEKALGGGALLDVGCYCVNSARLIFGREPVKAYATMTLTDGGVDLHTTGILEFGSGAVLHFDCSFGRYRGQRLSISGTRGELVMYTPFGPGKFNDVILTLNDQVIVVPAADQYQVMVEDFSQAALSGRDPRFTAEDAVKQMRALDAVTRSAASGEAVAV